MGRVGVVATRAPLVVISALALAFSGGVTAFARPDSAAAAARPSVALTSSVRWYPLTLVNGWASSQSQYGSGDPRVAIVDGIVYLAGSVHQAPGISRQFATLPSRFRPAHNLWLSVYTLAGAVGSIEIAANGRMSALGVNAPGFTSLAAISFPARSVRLRNLRLINGWASGQRQYRAGDPAVAMNEGVVYLAGSMHAAPAAPDYFATLPRGLRPARIVSMNTYMFEGQGGVIAINSDGHMYAEGYGFRADYFTSLAGLSFPVRYVRFRNLPLTNGWVPAPPGFEGHPAAGIQDGVVYLTGGMEHLSGTNEHFATLPRGVRPAHNLWLRIFSASGAGGGIEIATNGRMFAFGGDGVTDTMLAGISFPVSS